MSPYDSRLAISLEIHEAQVWADHVTACGRIDGDTLGATVERSDTFVMSALRAIDSFDVNRVVGLGVVSPATKADVERIVAFYRANERTRFRVELSPVARPAELPVWLEAADLQEDQQNVTKLFRLTCDVRHPVPDGQVQLLGLEHRRVVGELNAMAWGAGIAHTATVEWFGSTVGEQGFRHYGIFDQDRLISVGALAVRGTVGWVGFAASHPRYRGKGLRQKINEVRLAEARSLGCEVVHVEIEERYSQSAKLPFQRLYDRPSYSSQPLRRLDRDEPGAI